MLTCFCHLLSHCSMHRLECCTLQSVFDLENTAIDSDKVVKFCLGSFFVDFWKC